MGVNSAMAFTSIDAEIHEPIKPSVYSRNNATYNTGEDEAIAGGENDLQARGKT
jgi:hypothetical protein